MVLAQEPWLHTDHLKNSNLVPNIIILIRTLTSMIWDICGGMTLLPGAHLSII